MEIRFPGRLNGLETELYRVRRELIEFPIFLLPDSISNYFLHIRISGQTLCIGRSSQGNNANTNNVVAWHMVRFTSIKLSNISGIYYGWRVGFFHRLSFPVGKASPEPFERTKTEVSQPDMAPDNLD